MKRDVTAALKNVSHVCRLKFDETVAVVISGRGASGETRTMKRSSGGGSGAVAPRLTYAVSRSGGGESHGTKLILRARKADIDAFQKDKLSAEDFRKKVTTIVY